MTALALASDFEINHPLAHVESEALVLGKMLTDNSLIDHVADIMDASDFVEPVHRRIFEATLRDHALGKPVNPFHLKPYFDDDAGIDLLGGVSYLAKLTGDMSLTLFGLREIAATARDLRDYADRRRMQAGLEAAAIACADLNATNAEILAHADAALSGNAKDEIHQPSAAQCFDELIEGFRQKVPGLSCGRIPALDEVLGQLRPKQLVIGAGRPGMGKTAVALSYSIGAAMNGHGVLFVSLEMSSTELAGRMAADMAFDREPIPFNAIRDGTVTASQERLIVEAGSYLRGLPFQVVDAGNLTVGRLARLVRRHQRRMAANDQKLDLVVVDYLQLLSPDNKHRDNYGAVSEVSRALKAMAKDCGVAIMALAQLSREVEKRPGKKPMLSDLRDSGQIEQDADAVFFLYRAEYYIRQEEPDPADPKHMAWEQAVRDASGKIEFIVAKRRNGTTGSATGSFFGQYQAVR